MDSPEQLILAALSPAFGEQHSPVQVQKLLFLMTQEIPTVTGSHFDFQPHAYGPFDPKVYRVLEGLEDDGLVIVQPSRLAPTRKYSLTPKGQKTGEEVFASLDPRVQDYVTRASEFVRSLSFSKLVVSIYKAYPEMRVNSVFRQAAG